MIKVELLDTVLMPSTNPYSQEQQALLLSIAAQSIKSGLEKGLSLSIDATHYPSPLSDIRATFVTLEIESQLRGCIGMLQASRPLVEDVAENAFAAAFRDPRFPGLTNHEFEQLEIHISILSIPEHVSFENESDLIHKIRPNIDGLILSEGYQRGTFLPSVWESLPTPELFLQQLKQKAGLHRDYWSDTIQIERYTTHSFGAPIADIEV